MRFLVKRLRSGTSVPNGTKLVQGLERSFEGGCFHVVSLTQCGQQAFFGWLVGLGKGVDDHQCPLALCDVGTGRLAKGVRIRKHIDEIVHQLEAQAHRKSPLGHQRDDLLIGTRNAGANLGTGQEHHGSFAFNHLQIIRFINVQSLFELNVHLLALTDPTNHPGDAVHQRSNILGFEVFRLYQALERNGKHGITRVYRGGHAVFDVNGVSSSANFIIVHDVVVNECEIVDGFNGCTDVQQTGVGVPNGFGDEPRQGGPHPLSASFNEVHHGSTKSVVLRCLEA